ncbi:XRE family transcriptional regulator [Granulicella sp. dw_53]|jgi:transcriptional regulator with XRE-family HTH domain|uniref:helix-turn-helix domain-containing protein n=1 Tax=Granulicella sp. dw_53 TaxID=2719792 RepID=UPI001BD55ACA|nr:XRE family transcriptional regulator [Granulicella sp. dw_53]
MSQAIAHQTDTNTHQPEANAVEIVDPARIEQQIDEKLIGERIRRLRLKRSMGLVELGKLAGLSASFLSQLETGRVVPTLRNLARIALVFEKDLSFFFQPQDKVTFRRLDNKNRIYVTSKQKENSRFLSSSLSALIPDRHMTPCLAEFFPSGENCEFTPKVFTGTEFLYVIEGRLQIAIANQRHHLDTGDVFWIDANTPRQYLCIGAHPAKALIITEHSNK